MSTLRKLYSRHWALIAVLFAIVALLVTRLWNVYDPLNQVDSGSYFQAWERLKAGSIDCFRTPVYPAFIGILNDIFAPSTAICLIVFIQMLLYLTSIYALARICRDFLGMPRWLAIVATVPYYALNAFKAYTIFILTDSPATSLCIIFAYYFLRSLEQPGCRRAVSVGLFAGLLVLLRPSFLFIPIALLMTASQVWSISRRTAADTIAAAFICLCITGGYACIYHHKTGLWGVSCVGDINTVIMNADTLPGYDFDRDSLYAHYIFEREALETDPTRVDKNWPILARRAADDPRFLRKEVRAVEAANPGLPYRRTIRSVFTNLQNPVSGSRMTYSFFPIVALLYGMALALNVRRRNEQNYIARVFIWLLVCGQFAVVVLRAPNDYARLLMPVIPFIPAMCLDMGLNIVNRGASLLHRGSCGSRE